MSAAHDHGRVIPTPVRPRGRGGLRLVTGSRDRAAARAKGDAQIDHLHETPREAVAHLIDHVSFRGAIHEPACGKGAIARPLMEAGYQVIASDVARHGFGTPGVDFLSAVAASAPNIVTNPPFDHEGGERFAVQGLRLLRAMRKPPMATRKLVLLHRFRFFETPKRDVLFDDPAFQGAVIMARKRLPMMHREGYQGPKIDKSPELFAWWVWDIDRPRRRNEDPWMRRV